MKLTNVNGSAVSAEGEAKVVLVCGSGKCSMKFWDAVVERPLASVGAIVD